MVQPSFLLDTTNWSHQGKLNTLLSCLTVTDVLECEWLSVLTSKCCVQTAEAEIMTFAINLHFFLITGSGLKVSR